MVSFPTGHGFWEAILYVIGLSKEVSITNGHVFWETILYAVGMS